MVNRRPGGNARRLHCAYNRLGRGKAERRPSAGLRPSRRVVVVLGGRPPGLLAREARAFASPRFAPTRRSANDADSRLPRSETVRREPVRLADWPGVRSGSSLITRTRRVGLRVRISRGMRAAPARRRSRRRSLRFEDDRVEHCHSTPASRRMRLPSRSIFFMCTATRTSLPVGVLQQQMTAFS